MTLLTAAVVTSVVWSVSLVRSVRLRALIYSLPAPITVVLVATHIPVSAQHLLGVVLLNLFVAVVAWLHHYGGRPILLADLAGIAAYVGGSWTILHLGDLPFLPVLAATLVLWAIAVVLARRTLMRPRHQPPDRRAEPTVGRRGATLPPLGKLLVIGASALLVVALGGLLHGMVVTFPYSGVLVVIETRRDLVEFCTHFARNSSALLAFLTAYYFTQDISPYLALGAGWAAFLVGAFLLHLSGRSGVTTGHARPPTPAPG
jgi:hypothetical protein